MSQPNHAPDAMCIRRHWPDREARSAQAGSGEFACAALELPDFDLRRDRILHSAARAFVLQGFGETTLEEIAISAGVGKPTLYRYFASKEELLRAVIVTSLNEMIETARGDYDPHLNLEENLGVLAARMIGAMYGNLSSGIAFHRISRLIYSINLYNPDIVESVFLIFRERMTTYVCGFLKGIDGHPSEVSGRAEEERLPLAVHFIQMILASCLSLPLDWRPEASEIEALARSKVRLFLYGVRGHAG